MNALIDASVSLVDEAERAVMYFGSVPVSILDVFGSILSCMAYRELITGRKIWIETLISCTLLQFGGTTLTGLLLGQTPSWIMSHSAFPAILIIWWLIFLSPYDIFYRTLKSSKILIFAIKIGSAISAGHAVTSWGVDKVLWNTFHLNSERIRASLLTCILCGTLSGCGGGMLGDTLNLNYPSDRESTLLPVGQGLYRIRSPAVLAAMTRSFLCASIYYCLINPSGYLFWDANLVDKKVAHFYIVLLQVLHVTISTIYPNVNIFVLLGNGILYALGVPQYMTPRFTKDFKND